MNTHFNCKNSELVQDQNGFAHGSLPTVSGKFSDADARELSQDTIENNQGDEQQKREMINCKKVNFPCLACRVVAHSPSGCF